MNSQDDFSLRVAFKDPAVRSLAGRVAELLERGDTVRLAALWQAVRLIVRPAARVAELEEQGNDSP